MYIGTCSITSKQVHMYTYVYTYRLQWDVYVRTYISYNWPLNRANRSPSSVWEKEWPISHCPVPPHSVVASVASDSLSPVVCMYTHTHTHTHTHHIESIYIAHNVCIIIILYTLYTYMYVNLHIIHVHVYKLYMYIRIITCSKCTRIYYVYVLYMCIYTYKFMSSLIT